MKSTFYITTPIYYVNGHPHLGHAYTNIATDVLARWHRLKGDHTFFLTGTDEHGQKVAEAAEKQGKSPKLFVDEVQKIFHTFNQNLHITPDRFIRTTDTAHIQGAQALWNTVYNNGDIYLGQYAGYYAVRDEAYYTLDELTKKKDTLYAPSGAEAIYVTEDSYFFKLSKYTHKLLDFYAKNPDFIMPKSRFNEVIQFVKSGLKDLSISRTRVTWGIPVPNDSQHTMYVWFDALSNYITALGYPHNTQLYSLWPANIHMLGKDILRFHAVYWPAILLSANIALPKHMIVHGWWKSDGKKMSKSIGNVVEPLAIIEKYGLDALRFFMLWGADFADDKNFTYDSLTHVINSKLVNEWGNIVQRTLALIHKHCNGVVPIVDKDKVSTHSKNILAQLHKVNEIDTHLHSGKFHLALDSIWELVTLTNQYIDKTAPWKLIKQGERQAFNEIMWVVMYTIQIIALYLYPFTPDMSRKILDILRIPSEYKNLHTIFTFSPSGRNVHKSEIIYQRIVEE